MKREPTKKDYEIELNENGVPENDKKSNGGRISDYTNYGKWLRKNDPIAFECGFNEFRRQQYES